MQLTYVMYKLRCFAELWWRFIWNRAVTFSFCWLSFIVYEALSLVFVFFLYWSVNFTGLMNEKRHQYGELCWSWYWNKYSSLQLKIFSIGVFGKFFDLFVSFLGRSWRMWCANCVILLIHDERIIWKRNFFLFDAWV